MFIDYPLLIRYLTQHEIPRAQTQKVNVIHSLTNSSFNFSGEISLHSKLVGGPGVKPGFAASDAAVLFGYTTHPSGTRAGNPTRISSLGPKRHHALDHASLTNVEGMQRIEL